MSKSWALPLLFFFGAATIAFGTSLVHDRLTQRHRPLLRAAVGLVGALVAYHFLRATFLSLPITTWAIDLVPPDQLAQGQFSKRVLSPRRFFDLVRDLGRVHDTAILYDNQFGTVKNAILTRHVLFWGGLTFGGFFAQAVDELLRERFRFVWRYAVALGAIGGFFLALTTLFPNHKELVIRVKAVLPVVALGCLVFEHHRRSIGRPIAEKWKKYVGVMLALASIGAFYDGFKFGYPRYWHRWDQYHYYIGAKYFPELGYKNLYKCAVVAEDEAGVVKHHLDRRWGKDKAPERSVNLRAEMRGKKKKIRDLAGDNLLINVDEILAHPEQCRDRFTEPRWKEYVQ
ncbi:MAG: hypothetical protein AAGA56_12615, partial [Myxococcota bacterium]